MLRVFKIGFLLFAIATLSFAQSDDNSYAFQNRDGVLTLEFLTDQLVHFEFRPAQQGLSKQEIPMSPMIAVHNFRGPRDLSVSESSFKTSQMLLTVNAFNLCFQMKQRENSKPVEICPTVRRRGNNFGITISAEEYQNVYGLGQRFRAAGSSEGQWHGKAVKSPSAYGNVMNPFSGGAVGETQFPVFYGLKDDGSAISVFVDSALNQEYDFSGNPWRVTHEDPTIRGFVEAAPSLLVARRNYMERFGKAPVPSRKLFGFWLSEYGYDNWDELYSKLNGMRQDHFPIDGFFLDLQWFGGIRPHSDNTSMGKLQFDERTFPNAAETIAHLKNDENIGIIPIEESYIGKNLSEHRDLESRGFLAHECDHPNVASYLTGAVTGNTSEWWGKGGMLDWSNTEARSYWHRTKRQPLIDMGVMGHWLDLGEPEMFDPESCYAGVDGKTKHKDIHNLFSFLWAESVFDGYSESEHRPFSMLRSGTSGIQRFGAGLWSGDIGGNLESLATHQNAAMHLTFSGIDYISSDIGGFHRNRKDGSKLSNSEINENYTQWFAVSSWFDIPMRAHTINLENDQETAPNRVGEMASNLFNLRTRYELIPYYYSLAHHAYQTGEPIFYPMVMMHPTDVNVKEMGHERYVGPNLLVALTAKSGEEKRDVYLPAGEWYDFRTNQYHTSQGEWIHDLPTRENGIFRLIAFAKAGAIVPMAEVDGEQNLFKIRVFPGNQESFFDVIEDDGQTRGYQRGLFATTHVEQRTNTNGMQIVIHPTEGSYTGQPSQRTLVVQFISKSDQVRSVRLNGQTISDVRKIANHLYEMRIADQTLNRDLIIDINAQ